MINKVADLYQEFTNIKNIFVDAANPELISSLKREVAKNGITGLMFKRRWHTVRRIILISIRHMKVVPVPFSAQRERTCLFIPKNF